MDRKQKVNKASGGFVDKDLLTDEHDAIMLWLDLNLNDIFSKMGLLVRRHMWEMPILKGDGKYKTIVGYADMHVETECRESYIFEVKSQIKNAGEAIRQIRQYQCFTSIQTTFFIVCPDDKFKNVFESQGIKFIKCPPVKSDAGITEEEEWNGGLF